MKRDEKYYLSNIEQLCVGMEGNNQLAWEVFVQKVYADSKFVRKKNLSSFPENAEIHKDLVAQAIEIIVNKKSLLLEQRRSCESLIKSTITKISNLAIDYFRKYNKESGNIIESPNPWPPYSELNELVEKFLSTEVTEFLSIVFELSITGYKNLEIAEKLGVSESSVSSALHNVKIKLRAFLKDYRS